MNVAEPVSQQQLIDGLRAWAQGLWCVEAAVGLLIAHERWLARRDFREQAMWVDLGDQCSDNGLLVGIDWEAAAALAAVARASASERRMLQLAVALVAGQDHPVDLGDALTGLDGSNAARVVEAIAHAGGADRGQGRVSLRR